MIDFESQSAHTLLALAGQRGEIDTVRCDHVFAHLGAAERVRSGLRAALASHHLSELQFAILVLLSGAGSKPIPMGVLADHAGVSRSAVTDALDCLERDGLANRTRCRSDHCAQRDSRVIPVALTMAGRAKIERATGDYLQAITEAYLTMGSFIETLVAACGPTKREKITHARKPRRTHAAAPAQPAKE